VATDGWTDQSERRAIDVVKQIAPLGLAGVLYTDIDRDGMETGPNVEATATLARDGGVPVIASGGVGKLSHIAALAESGPGVVGAIVGRALHEKRFTLEEAIQASRSARGS
jgi:phosphoribosylformimino-5-aminoimidazole carboxamide ribotide isomerase